MLVLTRQEGEKICIGDKIVVEVSYNSNDRVRLGINAPPDKAVLRGELRGLSKEATEKARIVPADSTTPVACCR